MAELDQDLERMQSGIKTIEECKDRLREAQRIAEELKDKYLRAAAQVENVRRWTERDVTSRANEARRDLLRQLLEVIDNLERALAHPAEPEVLHQGVQLTHRQLEQVLARAGAERLGVAPGDPFDPTFHEAVEVRPGGARQDGGGDPMVVGVVQPGYRHEGILLRPARVIVRQ